MRWTYGIAVLLGITLPVGCAAPRCAEGEASRAARPEVLACEATERQPIEPDLTAVAPRRELSPEEAAEYCRLSEADALALAVRNATLAWLLQAESAAASAQSAAHRDADATALTQRVLAHLARHERNRAGAEALETYLRLVEAEAARDNLVQRLDLTDKILSDIAGIQARGLVTPVSQFETASQRLELVHRQAELRIESRQVHDRLVELLGIELLEPARLWPDADLVVDERVPPIVSVVQIALERRADLAALRTALAADEQARAAAGRILLAGRHSALGLSAPPSLLMLLGGHASTGNEVIRTQQLAEVLSDREREVEQEVKRAVHEVSVRLEQIAVTRARRDLALEHAQTVQRQQALQAGGALQVRRAQLDVLDAEQDLLHDVIEWKIAVVRLAAAQGALVYD